MSSFFERYKNILLVFVLLLQVGLMGWYIAERLDSKTFKAQILGETSDTTKEYMQFAVSIAELTKPFKQPDLEEFYRLVMSTLVTQKEGRFEPDLAASFTLISTENGRDVWNFRLNPAAKFASGRIVNSSDVIASLNAALPHSPGLGKATWKAIDQTTVEIRTTDANLLDTLTNIFIQPIDARDGELDGSGPYRVMSVDMPDISVAEIRLAPREGYHGTIMKSPVQVSLLASPYRFIARAISHILHEEKVTLISVPGVYIDSFRPHCDTDSSRIENEKLFDAICQ